MEDDYDYLEITELSINTEFNSKYEFKLWNR